MNPLTWILNRFRRKPDFIIGPPDRPYMLRWYLLPRNRWGNVYLHKFIRSDDDRALHDHPWLSLSIVVSGGYFEITQAADGTHERRWYSAGSILFRRPTSRHRIELGNEETGRWQWEAGNGDFIVAAYSPRPAWTVFITGPHVRTWGFWCPRGFVPWMEFVKPGQSGEVGKGCDE